jgi:protein-S-isoprenylcysteine O-methyltransferase Ste14
VLALFAAVAAALLVALIGALLTSIVWPERRLWPPPGQRSWQFVLMWGLTLAAFGAILWVGLLDWNSLGWPGWLRWPLGLGLIVCGNGVAWLGVRQLGMKTTSGASGPLVRSGLYRYSRNPQYFGDMLILSGWIVMSASAWAAPLAVLGIVAFWLTPWAEESWLGERYGEAYRDYCRATPRFIGLPRFTVEPPR